MTHSGTVLCSLILTLAISLPSRGDTTVVELKLSPARISNPPVTFQPVEARAPSTEATRLYRQAMLETWGVQVERNTDPVLDEMLAIPKSKLEGDDYLAWIDYMQSRYAKAIEMALEAHKLGTYAPISPLVDDDGDASLLPINGGSILAKLLMERVLHEMELEAPESVLENLPLVMSILHDWCQGVDIPVVSSAQDFESVLETILSRSDCPNLAFALSSIRSPFEELGNYKKNHPEVWRSEFKMTPEWLAQLFDPKSEDALVIEHCRVVLMTIFRKLCNSGVPEIESLNSFEQWLEVQEDLAPQNRRVLVASGIEFPVSTAYERLAVAAGITRFREHANWTAELFQLPIHLGVVRYNQGQSSDEHSMVKEGNGLCHIGIGFTNWSPRVTDYWYSQQTIKAMAMVSLLRNDLAIHSEFPTSLRLQELDAGLDPLSNRPWKYERVSPHEATLELEGVDGKTRKTYRLLRSEE